MESLASPSVILSVSVLSVLLVRFAVGPKQPKDVQTLPSPVSGANYTISFHSDAPLI